jgi:hypothetical protein
MAVSLSVTRTFIVNGKEYGSIDELPEAIRNALESHLSVDSDKKTYTDTTTDTTKTKIVFNNQEYASTNEMPRNVREAYQQALQVAGLTAPEETSTVVPGFSKAFHAQKAIVPVSGASGALRILILSGGLILMLYFVLCFLR